MVVSYSSSRLKVRRRLSLVDASRGGRRRSFARRGSAWRRRSSISRGRPGPARSMGGRCPLSKQLRTHARRSRRRVARRGRRRCRLGRLSNGRRSDSRPVRQSDERLLTLVVQRRLRCLRLHVLVRRFLLRRSVRVGVAVVVRVVVAFPTSSTAVPTKDLLDGLAAVVQLAKQVLVVRDGIFSLGVALTKLPLELLLQVTRVRERQDLSVHDR